MALFFLIYINDLPGNVQFSCQIIAEYTSFLSHVFDKYKSQNVFSDDLQVISNWAFQWKMQFIPDPNKQAKKVYFLEKSNNENSIYVTFNNTKVVTFSTQKY